MNENCGIYKITNPIGQVYIGQSRNIRKRKNYYKNNHKSLKRQRKIYESLKKYGWEEHTFEIVELCEIEDFNCRERFWQDTFNVLSTGLNLVLTECGLKTQEYPKEFGEAISKRVSGELNPMFGKVGAMKGRHHTEETKQLLREANSGDKNHNFGKYGELNPFYGKHHSEESINKIKEGLRNYYKENKHPLQGVAMPEERKQKISSTKTGVPSPRKGVKLSEELKEKMRSIARTRKKRNYKKVIDTSTNIIYDSVAELARILKIDAGTLRPKLNGKKPNNTTFKYYE